MRKKVLIYLIFFLICIPTLGFAVYYRKIDFGAPILEMGAYCFLIGSLGGITHCLRSVYIESCVRDAWDDKWAIWYFLRPILSGICGIVSLLLIKAGLLAFTSQADIADRPIAFFAVAFLAGYNVQNFLSKMEDVSKATLGIEKKYIPPS